MKYFKKKHLNFYIQEKNFIDRLTIGSYGVCFKKNGILNFLQYKALTFFLKKRLKFYSKLYLRLNITLKMTKKPIGVRMGKGKGALDLLYVPVKKGQIFFEFGFKKIENDILSYQNILMNIDKLQYFNRKVKKIIKLASLKLRMQIHLYKNFK